MRTDEPDEPAPRRPRRRRRRLRAAASGTLIGAGIVLLGFALGRTPVILVGVAVLVAAWLLAAGTRIRRRQPRRANP